MRIHNHVIATRIKANESAVAHLIAVEQFSLARLDYLLRLLDLQTKILEDSNNLRAHGYDHFGRKRVQ